MAQMVFNRYEKKYLLSREQYEKLMEKVKPYVKEDLYKEYEIRNIYYDTEQNELIRTSIEKPVYKEKFRIRCYGQPTKDSKVFLEIKKKYNGLVNKRRITLPYSEAEAYLKGNREQVLNKQISGEITYLMERYELKPRLYLAYNRIAFSGLEDDGFRLTFDYNIRGRWEELNLVSDEKVESLLEEGQRLMEVKVNNALPLWFVKILSELEIRSTSFSKYGLFYRKHCKEGYICYEL